MFRFYINAELKINAKIVLEKKEYHHLIHVLRAKPGQTISVFNGKGGIK